MLITTKESRLLAAGLATGDHKVREATKAEELHTALVLAAQELHDALDGQHQTAEAVADARFALREAEQGELADGVEGPNAEARGAYLYYRTKRQHDHLRDAERILATERVRVEQARLAWDLARYRVRLEVKE